MLTSVLKLDAAGNPLDWIDLERAALYVAKDLVLWSYGNHTRVLRGGHNEHGEQSVMELPSIMAVKGRTQSFRHDRTVSIEPDRLFKRDRYMCAYCGNVFKERELEIEHVHPEARGGKLVWSNVVSACRSCNARKGCRTPEEAGMPLLYVPYAPNMHEGLLLKGRRVLVDQMQWLMQGVPKHSRLHGWIDEMH